MFTIGFMEYVQCDNIYGRCISNTIQQDGCKKTLLLTARTSNISSREMNPFPLMSYIWKLNLSLSSMRPLNTMLKPHTNSRKSSFPSAFWSNTRNTCFANSEASPSGKKVEYSFLNSSDVSTPLGHLLLNSLYQSWISSTVKFVWSLSSARVRGANLLCRFPITEFTCLLLYDLRRLHFLTLTT